MKPGVMPSIAVFALTLLAAASMFASHPPFQDSASAASQQPAKKSGGQESQTADSPPEERKKAKKVWTNDNLNEVSGSAISQIGGEKDRPADKTTPARLPNPQVVAAFRKQLAALQAQSVNLEKQIADLKSFSKGEAPGAAGMQWHKSYSMEPIEDQIRKLEEKKKQVGAQIDTVFDAARKLGIEPGQLR